MKSFSHALWFFVVFVMPCFMGCHRDELEKKITIKKMIMQAVDTAQNRSDPLSIQLLQGIPINNLESRYPNAFGQNGFVCDSILIIVSRLDNSRNKPKIGGDYWSGEIFEYVFIAASENSLLGLRGRIRNKNITGFLTDTVWSEIQLKNLNRLFADDLLGGVYYYSVDGKDIYQYNFSGVSFVKYVDGKLSCSSFALPYPAFFCSNSDGDLINGDNALYAEDVYRIKICPLIGGF